MQIKSTNKGKHDSNVLIFKMKFNTSTELQSLCMYFKEIEHIGLFFILCMHKNAHIC